jgi:hypothetical protein
MKITVFWNVAPCSLEDVFDVSEVLTVSIIRAVTLMIEAVSTSETSVNFCQTTQRNVLEDSHLQHRHLHCRENLNLIRL